jgi:hypothetical protein
MLAAVLAVGAAPAWVQEARPGAAGIGAGVVVDYRVQPGDTLFALLRDGADWQPVARANNIADPKRLQPGSLIRIPAHLLREQPALAEVVHAYGSVTVTRASTETAVPLAGGETLAAGDVVRTGVQSSTTLRFVDGARVLVRPDSELKIERLAQSRAGASTTLRLERGSADSAVPPVPTARGASAPSRYEMRTPHANLGVRGTEFRTTAESASVRVEVLEGRVGARGGVSAPGRSEALSPGARSAEGRPANAAARSESLVGAGFGAVGAASGMSAPRALPAPPQLAGLPERVERMPLRLSWQSAAATRVRAQVLTTDEPPRLVLDGVFDAAPARWSEDIPDGRYELRVRAIDDSGLEGRDTRAAFVLKARPEPPFIAAPAPGARTIDDNVRLAWTRNAAAPRVRLQIADTPDFAQPRIDRSDLAASEARMALPLGTHHWRVASILASGDQGPFSDAQRFTRIEPPAAPPPAEPQQSDDGLLLRWPASAPEGTRWQVQVARDAAFAQMARDETVSTPQLLLRDPPSGTYYLRVKTIDADGFAGPFGQPQQIEVPSSPWWWLLVPAVLLLL